MLRRYKLSIWHSEEEIWEYVEFEAESRSNEAKEKAIAIYRERNLDNNCFLYVWIEEGDKQFIKKYHNSWKCISYFAAANKEEFLSKDYLKRR